MIWGIIELIIFVIALLLFVSLVIAHISLRLESNKLKTNLTQEAIDRAIVMEKLKEVMENEDKTNVSQTDGFLKFVSDSRDAAFKYIEDVQSAIKEFDVKIGPVVQYYKETGKVLQRKPSELVKDISDAYDKLMESMPKEDNV